MPAVSIPALRAALGQQLPAAMVPAHLVSLAALPLLPNGKLDRRQLPAPEPLDRADGDRPILPARTPAESLVAFIFARVLRIERDRLSVDDSFFDRGGHSLLAVQAIIALREAFGLDVPISTLFEHPTVEAFVASLAGRTDRSTLDDIAAAVLEVDELSDEEVRARLAVESC
jgi:acyl carrier protein